MKKVETKKIKDDELKLITEHQNSLTSLIQDIGVLETKKHAYCHQIAELNREIEDYKEVLEGIYGSININLEDGSYTEINKDVQDNKED